MVKSLRVKISDNNLTIMQFNCSGNSKPEIWNFELETLLL